MKLSVVTFLIVLLLSSHDSISEVMNSILDTGELKYITAFTSDEEGNSYLAAMQPRNNDLQPMGDTKILKINPQGDILWEKKLEGFVKVSEMMIFNNKLIIAGMNDSLGRFENTDLQDMSMFYAQISDNGISDWIKFIDSIDGNYSQLEIDSKGNFLLTGDGTDVGRFQGSVIMRVDINGEVIDRKFIKGISVSDVASAPDGSIFLAGMLGRQTVIDDIEVIPEFGYPNIALKLSPEMKAEWVKLTEYVTGDSHHRVEILDNKAAFYQIMKTGEQIWEPVLKLYDGSGMEVAEKRIIRSQIFNNFEMSVSQNNLIVTYDAFNYSNPDIDDTLDILILDSDLNVQETHKITSQVQSKISRDINPFLVSSDSCSIYLSTVFTRSARVDNGDEINGIYENENVLLTKFDRDCSLSSVGEPDDSEFVVYPNPATDKITINIPELINQEISISIFDMTGRELFNKNFNKNSFDLNLNFDNGNYLLTGKSYNGDLIFSKIITVVK